METTIIPLPDKSVMVYKGDVQIMHAPNNLRTANRLWSMYGDSFVPYLPHFDFGELPVYSVWATNQDGVLRPFGLTTNPTNRIGYIVVEGACMAPTDDQISTAVEELREEMARSELLRPYNLLRGTITLAMEDELTVKSTNGTIYTVYISAIDISES